MTPRNLAFPNPRISAFQPPHLPADWPPSTLEAHSLFPVGVVACDPIPGIETGLLCQRAAHLAASMLHNVHTAAAHSSEWYADEMAPTPCNADDSAYLRIMTMVACRDHRDLIAKRADLVGRSPVLEELRRQERQRQASIGLVVVFAVLLILLFGWWTNAKEIDAQRPGAAHPVAEVQL